MAEPRQEYHSNAIMQMQFEERQPCPWVLVISICQIILNFNTLHASSVYLSKKLSFTKTKKLLNIITINYCSHLETIKVIKITLETKKKGKTMNKNWKGVTFYQKMIQEKRSNMISYKTFFSSFSSFVQISNYLFSLVLYIKFQKRTLHLRLQEFISTTSFCKIILFVSSHLHCEVMKASCHEQISVKQSPSTRTIHMLQIIIPAS